MEGGAYFLRRGEGNQLFKDTDKHATLGGLCVLRAGRGGGLSGGF